MTKTVPDKKEEKQPEEKQPEVPVEKGEASSEQKEEVFKEGKYITVAELAEKLRYSTQWVLWMCQQGRIKAVKPLGGRWRIPMSEYEKILKSGVRPLTIEKKEPVVNVIPVEKEILEKVQEPEKKGRPTTLFPFGLLFKREDKK